MFGVPGAVLRKTTFVSVFMAKLAVSLYHHPYPGTPKLQYVLAVSTGFVRSQNEGYSLWPFQAANIYSRCLSKVLLAIMVAQLILRAPAKCYQVLCKVG